MQIRTTDGRSGYFDLKPYLTADAFLPLKEVSEFIQVSNRGYFIEWPCGADLSADTLEAKMTATLQPGKTTFRVNEGPEES
ncbi:DUF2442 domain-containing protein [Chitinispirillales bacterium ANBcel5]|uniref:DUF2442 domain-containing protein n=1 Tax=Cellulosispirillum alkaliphilum TaxID=3039283 RepID=UPI002A4F4A93|nr:DUF2442 domain-containing protein [Chitinispirillales bacterium ANBcel5]